MWFIVEYVSIGAGVYTDRTLPDIEKHTGLRIQRLRGKAQYKPW